MPRWLRWSCLGATLFLLLVAALESRLPQMKRSFWEDEVHHNDPVVAHDQLGELTRSLAPQFQPSLEYLLRKTVWFPLFGWQERALRLPSLFYSLCTVGLAFGASFGFFRRRGLEFPAALLFALLLGGWVVWNPSDAHNAVEARHYAFVSLVSVGWCAVYFLTDRRAPLGFGLVSLLFANAHFFALPLILTAYLLESGAAWRTEDYRRLAGWLVSLTVVLAVTRWVNDPAWSWLTNGPPGAHHIAWSVAVAEGAKVWWGFLAYLGGAWLAGAGFLCLTPAVRRSAVGRLLFVVGVVLPAFFVYLRVRSEYGFSDRYYSPFFGLGFAALALLAPLLHRCLQALVLVAAASEHNRRLALALGAAAVLLMVGVGRRDWHARKLLRLPPENFSPYFAAYQGLKKEPGPLFILHERPGAADVTKFYLRFIGQPIAAHWDLVCSLTDGDHPVTAHHDLVQFLAAHPEGTVILDRVPRDGVKPGQQQAPSFAGAVALGPPGATLEEVPGYPGMLWKVVGARTAADVGAAARMVGFHAVDSVFAESDDLRAGGPKTP